MNYKHSIQLKTDFFNRSTIVVARELLGKYLCRRLGDKVIRAKITETEAYCGVKDKACHASRGLTPRTKVMFGPPGYAYVYMIYGMYYCLNIVTEEVDNPSAVLIRGAEVLPDSKFKILNYRLNGPGKLCRELKIDKKFNGIDICKRGQLWIEDRGEVIKKIKKGKRIGVDYAGKWKDKLWRFWYI